MDDFWIGWISGGAVMASTIILTMVLCAWTYIVAGSFWTSLGTAMLVRNAYLYLVYRAAKQEVKDQAQEAELQEMINTGS